MRKSRYQYQAEEMIVLDDETISQFTSLYLQKNKLIPDDIKDYPVVEWKQEFLFEGIEEWIDLFEDPSFEDRNILIVGDYDVDGIMSSKIALWICQKRDVSNVEVYIPNRFTDGYGLNKTIVKNAFENGFDTILTVDNGIAAVDTVQYANELGIEVLLTDHHHLKDILPQAELILHPEIGNVNKGVNICGTAVIFALAHALFEKESEQLIPYVMLATLADSMELIHLNRSFVIEGIKRMRTLKDPFLQQLIEVVGIDVESSKDLSWKLIPVLNAIGRLSDVNEFSEVLFYQEENVHAYVEKAIQLNNLRKEYTEKIVSEVLSKEYTAEIVCETNKEWHQGVLGIAASRIAERLNKPVILFAEVDGIHKGSGRSPQQFNLFQFLQSQASLLYAFGGHSQACGLSIKATQYEAFKSAIENVEKSEVIMKTLDFNIEKLSQKAIGLLYKQIEKLEPFGNRIPTPCFTQKVSTKSIRYMGSEQQHVKITLPNQLQFLFFNEEEKWRLTEQANVFVLGELSVNRWQDTISYQSIVLDWWIDEVEVFYPNQIPENMAKQLFSIKHLPKTEEMFEQMKKEAFLHGNILLNWQEDLKNIVAVDEDKIKKVYKYFLSQDSVLRNEAMYTLFKRNGIEKNEVNFSIFVFLDLEFVIIENEVIKIKRDIIKRSLSDSKSYQIMQFQHQFVERVVYAPHEEIKKLFTQMEENK